jgi:hypothetical protein
MIIVKRDSDGDPWMNLGNGRWALVSDVMRGRKYADRWANTEEDIETYGPFSVEWEIEEREKEA